MTRQEAEDYIRECRRDHAVYKSPKELDACLFRLAEAWRVLKQHGITMMDNAGNFVTGV